MDSAVRSSKPQEIIMRKQFIESTEAATREEAERIAPWAAEIFEVEGGWQAFESMSDADQFQAQA